MYVHLPDAAVILCWRPALSCTRPSCLQVRLISLFVATWRLSVPVLVLMILSLMHPDDAMRIFGAGSEFRKGTGRGNQTPLGRMYDCVKWPGEVWMHTRRHSHPTA